MKLSSQVRK